MPVMLLVPAAGHVDPVVATVGGFEDELVEVGVVLQEVEPAVGDVHVGVVEVVIPIGVGSLGKLYVGGFTEGVLTGVGATDFDVQLVTAVAGGDDDGSPPRVPPRGDDWLAKVRRGSRMVWQSCWRAGMRAGGTRLSMPYFVAVAERSNSARVKCSESFKDGFIGF